MTERFITLGGDRKFESALNAAMDSRDELATAYDECECDLPIGERCPHAAAYWQAEHAVDIAREALAASGESRAWDLSEGGTRYDTVHAGSAGEALEIALLNFDASAYDAETTMLVRLYVACPATGEQSSTSVEIVPAEPACSIADEHDWQTPYEIVGGLEENPGVFGHGGGVITHAVCMHCGCGRATDTWATDPETGRQGLTSVSYDRGKYSRELAAMQGDSQ